MPTLDLTPLDPSFKSSDLLQSLTPEIRGGRSWLRKPERRRQILAVEKGGAAGGRRRQLGG